MARRQAGHRRGLRRLAEALVGARFDGPEARAGAAGVQGRQRQDVPDRAQGEIRSSARIDRQAVGRGPFMMPKRVAETDPFKQIDDYTGSGPFILKKDEWKPGEKTVYVKNPKYKPRPEPMSGLSGGKVVSLDRVEWGWIQDPPTQINTPLTPQTNTAHTRNSAHLT